VGVVGREGGGKEEGHTHKEGGEGTLTRAVMMHRNEEEEGKEGGARGAGVYVPAAFTPSFWISPMPTIVSSTSMSCWPAEASEGRSACCCPPPMIACCVLWLLKREGLCACKGGGEAR
jgi:hypothetical protein